MQDRSVLTQVYKRPERRWGRGSKRLVGTGAEKSRQIRRVWRPSWGAAALRAFFIQPRFAAAKLSNERCVVEQAIQSELRLSTTWCAK
jgi:hypothetical protein